MQLPTIYGAPAHMVVLAVVLAIVYVVLVVRFILHMRRVSAKKQQTVLIVGPRNSGKTQLVHALRDGAFVETVSSMKELSATFAIHAKHNPQKIDTELNVVDFPGHERLRSRVADFYPITGAIVFVVDASDPPMLRKAAEFLYDIFANAKINDKAPPLLVVCNKSDAVGSLSVAAVQQALEAELTQLKATRSSLETDGDDDTTDQSIVPVGRDGVAFTFAVDAPCATTFAATSVKKNAVRDVVTFMHGTQ